MCLPFMHKWKFELITELEVRDPSTRTVYMHKYIYVGTCSKCGTIKEKIIRSR